MTKEQVNKKISVLVVGCGNMGVSHATAYHHIDGFEIVGLVSRGTSNKWLNDQLGGQYPLYSDYKEALEKSKPNAVCVATYPDTHEEYAIKALEAGCHVFIEKPLADTIAGAERVATAAAHYNKKLVIGYILRYHPSWNKFIELGKELGKPLVMRMNLNQQSRSAMWQTHLNLMKSLSPIVDCGVHYIDVMCQMVGAKPVKVHAIGARLTDEVPVGNYNYGQLQIQFEDGSVGWYEAGWGPMISETAYFVKDVFGPKGAVSIVAKDAVEGGASDDVGTHTKTDRLKIHYAELDREMNFAKADEWLDMSDEPDHQGLCDREQAFFLKAIGEDLDLQESTQQAIDSLKIALACDESIRSGNIVYLT